MPHADDRAAPAVAGTVDFEAVRLHYFDDHPEIRRSIVPVAHAVDFRHAPARPPHAAPMMPEPGT